MEGEEPSVGIDVSKSVLDVSLYPSGNTWQVEYSPPCVTGLAEELADRGRQWWLWRPPEDWRCRSPQSWA